MTAELAALFPHIDRKRLREVAALFCPVEFGPGVRIIEEGEEDTALLFIVEGEASIQAGEIDLGRAGAGDVIGEIAFFAGGLRIASVTAQSACICLSLERKDFDGLLARGHELAYAIEKRVVTVLVGRLVEVDRLLSGDSSPGAAPPDESEPAGEDAPGLVRIDVLAQNGFFRGAPIGALDDLAHRMQVRSYAAGSALCQQGAAGRALYVLVQGEVDVRVDHGRGGPISVGTLDAGAVFGMSSVLEDRPRIASCIAKTEVVALRMERQTCLSLAAEDGGAASVLRTALIRAMGGDMADAIARISLIRLRS